MKDFIISNIRGGEADTGEAQLKMDWAQVLSLVRVWLQERGFSATADGPMVRAAQAEQIWHIVCAGDLPQPLDYLRAFDAALEALIPLATQSGNSPRLAVAVAFDSCERGEEISYRRALKKYSNSIIFTDLGIHLLLVRESQPPQVLTPPEINPFLRDLNRYIIRAKDAQ